MGSGLHPRNQGDQEKRTTWEYTIPSIEAGAVSRTDELPMDREAFAGFYQRSAPALRAYLVRVSGNFALAEDLLQESYLRFLCATQPEGGEVNYRRYLFRIATNLLRDHWRKPRVGCLEDIPEQFLTAQDSSAQAELQTALGPAMAQMRPRERSYCGWLMPKDILIARLRKLLAWRRRVFACSCFGHVARWRVF